MDMHQLAATFTALVHEERRRDSAPGSERNVLGSLSQDIEKSIGRFVNLELRAGFEQPIKQPSYAIAAATDAWSRGASVEKVEYLAGQDGGDFVRTMRMAVQMMRQLRSALGRDYALYNRLGEAGVSINRDVVDAKRQFELG
jgi:superfamily II RNA helicase